MPNAATLHDEAVTLLRNLSGPHGIRASLTSAANYEAVFTRDAVMAGIAGILLEDAAITEGFVWTLTQLRELQGGEGQIASNYFLRGGQRPQASFGTVVPRIDATTWYLIGIAFAERAGLVSAAEFRESARAATRLLDALEYNGRHLIYIPAGGNWADEYVYEGYILYDQLLRAWALRLLGAAYGQSGWTEKSARIEETVAAHYWPNGRSTPHPMAAFSPTTHNHTFDLAAASLLGVSGLLTDRAKDTLDWIAERFLARGALPPVFDPAIEEGEPNWPALRRYHLYEFRNQPHEYHNGGIWFIWLGWLALAFARSARVGDAARLRDLALDALDALPDFQFNEFLHGKTGATGGTGQMAYTATGIVFLLLADSPLVQRRLFP